MPERHPFTIGELFALLVGVRAVASPPDTEHGRDYYTELDEQGLRVARELKWVLPSYFPFLRAAAYEYSSTSFFSKLFQAPHAGWLWAEIITNILDEPEPYRALHLPNSEFLEILDKDIYKDMPDATDVTQVLAAPKDTDFQYRFGHGLVLSSSRFDMKGQPGRVFGLGIRRRLTIFAGDWAPDPKNPAAAPSDALSAQVDLYFPLLAVDDHFKSVNWRAIPAESRCIQFGLAFDRGGNALGSHNDVQMSALRFNGRLPLNPGSRFKDQGAEIAVGFDKPIQVIQFQIPGDESWRDGDEDVWRSAVETMLEEKEVVELLEGPLAPVTAETMSVSSIKKLLLNTGKTIKGGFKKILAQLGSSLPEWKELWRHVPDERDPDKPPSPQDLRALGQFLAGLKLVKRKGRKRATRSYELSKKMPDFWAIMRDMLREFDGFPLFASGLDPEDLEKDHVTRKILQLAANGSADASKPLFFGLRGLIYDIVLKKKQDIKNERDIEILLHLGKWLSGETLAYNWVQRLLPKDMLSARTGLPGIGLFPVSFLAAEEGKGRLAQDFRIEMTSLGVDIQGTNKHGLLKLPYFKLNGLELRFMGHADVFRDERETDWSFGLAFKLRDMSLSFAPKKDEDRDEVFDGIARLFPDDDMEPESEEPDLDTRLSDELKEKFSFSFGAFMSSEGGPFFDIQLYDASGKAGKTVWIPIERSAGKVYLKSFGIALQGLNALGKGKDILKDKSALILRFTGGLRFSSFELGLIGAGLKIFLAKEKLPQWVMQGLDVSFKAGPAQISGALLQTKTGFAGQLRFQLDKLTLGAMGAYSRETDPDDESRKFTSFFVYLSFSFGEGAGIGGPSFKITGLAGGFGYNRAVHVPPVNGVAEFSLVKLVMGTAKLSQFEDPNQGDPRKELSEPEKKVLAVLKHMQHDLVVEEGQSFACAGLRFTLFEFVDCFALLIVQFGEEFEIDLLGIARFKLARSKGADSGKVICFAELQILARLNPAQGIFRLEARLSDMSWIFHKSCKLTGGFALAIWFGEQHAGDWVGTLGGYAPTFKRPAHYPAVPRVGMHYVINPNMTLKGGCYFAVTPACLMAGGAIEASYRSDRFNAWFTIYMHLLARWNPTYFNLNIGIAIRLQIIFLKSWDVNLSIDLDLWWPKFGCRIKIDLKLFSFDKQIGEDKQESLLVATWAEFGRNFIDQIEKHDEAGRPVQADPDNGKAEGKWQIPKQGGDPVAGPAVIRPALTAGHLVGARSQDHNSRQWDTRADTINISVHTAVPVSQLQVGEISQTLPKGEVAADLTLAEPLPVQNPVTTSSSKVRVHPMNRDLDTTLSVALVRESDEGQQAQSLQDWIVEPARSNLPAALWHPDETSQPDPEQPLVEDRITGLESLRPPLGSAEGKPRPVAAERMPRNALQEREVASEAAPESSRQQSRQALDTLAKLGYQLPSKKPVRRMKKRSQVTGSARGWGGAWMCHQNSGVNQ